MCLIKRNGNSDRMQSTPEGENFERECDQYMDEIDSCVGEKGNTNSIFILYAFKTIQYFDCH